MANNNTVEVLNYILDRISSQVSYSGAEVDKAQKELSKFSSLANAGQSYESLYIHRGRIHAFHEIYSFIELWKDELGK